MMTETTGSEATSVGAGLLGMFMLMPPLPNFFIVGAPKAGTTSLYHYLRQHPDVYMSPIKEPNFFASEFRLEHMSPAIRPLAEQDAPALAAYLDGPMRMLRFGGVVTRWDQYLKLFRLVAAERAIGEASVAYLWSRSAAANIHQRIPDARIVMVLRNPADRAFSQYVQAVAKNRTRLPFDEFVRERARHLPETLDLFSPFLEYGLYFRQVERFLDRFGSERVRIYLYEDYSRNREATVRDLLRWLGVDPQVPLDLSQRHHEARVPRFPAFERYVMLPAIAVLGAVVPERIRRAARPFRYRPRAAFKMSLDDRR